VKDGERNFDVLRAREKFNDYIPGKTPLVLKRADQSETTDASVGFEQETPKNLFIE
jgi:hypothetical protein